MAIMTQTEYTNKILNAIGKKGLTQFSKEEQAEFKEIFKKYLNSGLDYETVKIKVKEELTRNQRSIVEMAKHTFDVSKSIDNLNKANKEIKKLDDLVNSINKKFDYYESLYPTSFIDPRKKQSLLKLFANSKQKYDNLNPVQKFLALFKKPSEYDPAKIILEYKAIIDAMKASGIDVKDAKTKANKLILANTEEIDGKKLYRDYNNDLFSESNNPKNILEEVNYNLQNDLSKDLKDKEFTSYKEINILDNYEEIEKAIYDNQLVEENSQRVLKKNNDNNN